YSVLEVIKKANEITDNLIKYDFSSRRPGDAEKLVSNVEKINKCINWKPEFNDIRKIIQSSIDWEKKIYEKNL
ncbi:UDP-glucose 4-epimerase GalE, partial [bacterium]|nr:UDP-glucose 4-epimerase GalE [bacterium]